MTKRPSKQQKNNQSTRNQNYNTETKKQIRFWSSKWKIREFRPTQSPDINSEFFQASPHRFFTLNDTAKPNNNIIWTKPNIIIN